MSSKTTSSLSTSPTPITIEPSTWPWKAIGLITVPESWASVKRTILTTPVSGSTSTSHTEEPKLKAGEVPTVAPLNSPPRFGGGS